MRSADHNKPLNDMVTAVHYWTCACEKVRHELTQDHRWLGQDVTLVRHALEMKKYTAISLINMIPQNTSMIGN